jgi:hypothetical protein
MSTPASWSADTRTCYIKEPPTLVSNGECGAGYAYDASKSAATCVGPTCDASGVDQDTCCTMQATCGDKDGVSTDYEVSLSDCRWTNHQDSLNNHGNRDSGKFSASEIESGQMTRYRVGHPELNIRLSCKASGSGKIKSITYATAGSDSGCGCSGSVKAVGVGSGAGRHTWPIATQAYGTNQHIRLETTGEWKTYTDTWKCEYEECHIMLEDFASPGGSCGNAYFDNFVISDADVVPILNGVTLNNMDAFLNTRSEGASKNYKGHTSAIGFSKCGSGGSIFSKHAFTGTKKITFDFAGKDGGFMGYSSNDGSNCISKTVNTSKSSATIDVDTDGNNIMVELSTCKGCSGDQVAAIKTLKATRVSGGGTDPVNDDNCGAGYVYNASKSTAACAGMTCDAGGVDRETCCNAKDGLVALFLFKPPLGTSLVDSGPHSIPAGTIHGNPKSIAGPGRVASNAIHFDSPSGAYCGSSNAWAEISSTLWGGDFFSANNVTFDFWFQFLGNNSPENYNDDGEAAIGIGPGNDHPGLWVGGRKGVGGPLRWVNETNVFGSNLTATRIHDAEWHHIVWTTHQPGWLLDVIVDGVEILSQKPLSRNVTDVLANSSISRTIFFNRHSWSDGKSASCRQNMKLANLQILKNTAGGGAPDWSDGAGLDCASYASERCANGAARPGSELMLGSKYNFPENNCAVCGKTDSKDVQVKAHTCGDKDGTGTAVSDADCSSWSKGETDGCTSYGSKWCANNPEDNCAACGRNISKNGFDGYVYDPSKNESWLRVMQDGKNNIPMSASFSVQDQGTCCVAPATCGAKTGITGAVSGTKYSPIDFDGQGRTVETIHGCRARCAAVAECAYWSRWDDGGCHLSLSCARPFPASGVTSGSMTTPQSPVSDTDCGTGFVYDASKSAAACAGATCNASGVDRETCCVVQATCGDTEQVSKQACEGNTLNISCADRGTGVINVQSATNGRHHGPDVCNHTNLTANVNLECSTGNSTEVVAALCNDKINCNISDFNSIFVDPCLHSFKHLTVQYDCGPGTAVVSDADCGIGYAYDASKSAATCAGSTCNASGIDHKTCCNMCSAGYYCSGVKRPCGGVGLYCPKGSGKPLSVTAGYFTTPVNVSKELKRESQVRVRSFPS